MTIFKLAIDEKNIYVCIVNGEHRFKGLTKKLSENVTKNQIDQITTWINNKHIIVYRDLIDCYSCNGEKTIGDETCICGKKKMTYMH